MKMTVMSYIAYPRSDKNQLLSDLLKIKGCDAEMSTNENVIVLVTAAESEIDEKRIKTELDKLESLACLTLVYAGNEDQTIESNL